MALKIRLRQQGQLNRPFYRIVVTDCRAPRDGKYLEMVGWYNPFEEDKGKGLSVDGVRVQHWLEQGAQLTESAESLVLKAAPNVIHWLTDKRVAKQAKMRAKRRAKQKTMK